MSHPNQTATFVRELRDLGRPAEQRLYRLDPPLKTERFSTDSDVYGEVAYTYVITSAVVVGATPETYIFGADPSGEILDWLELPGSYTGGLDHEHALYRAGYEVES